jgi:hypothetical protein
MRQRGRAHGNALSRLSGRVRGSNSLRICWEDMLAWVDIYARQTRMEKRAIIDLALRTFRALMEGEGGAEA